MNVKSHACDCSADMPTQRCVRYCTGECEGPNDTPSPEQGNQSNTELRDGLASSVTYTYDIIVNLPDGMEEHIHGKCDSPEVMLQAIEEYSPNYTSAVVIFTKSPMRQSRAKQLYPAPPETIEQHLKRLYPEHYVKIITNSTRDGGPEHTAQLLGYYARGIYAKPLEVMFLWDNTPEGRAFWKALAERSA